MADHSATIAALDAAIHAGVTTVRMDTQTITYRSLEEMQRIRRGLIDEDTSGTFDKFRRPRCATIRLDRF